VENALIDWCLGPTVGNGDVLEQSAISQVLLSSNLDMNPIMQVSLIYMSGCNDSAKSGRYDTVCSLTGVFTIV
jgi:hypothetical protein